jgi:hypothetical protein
MFLVPWFIAILFAISDEIVVSLLLRRQYTGDRSSWEADGKPRGVFWIPPEAKIGRWYVTYASGHAGQLARWKWLFTKPKWMAQVGDAHTLMLLHRIFLPAFLLFTVAPFVIAFLVSSR